MPHILLFDVPGGSDFAVLEDAVALGHEVTFCTSDLAHYTSMGPEIVDLLKLAKTVVEIPGFEEQALLKRLDEIHAETPFQAVICLIDIRLMVAAKVARHYGLRFLSTEVVQLTRNKTAVREKLKQRGIEQPGFAQATSAAELMDALAKTGYPAIVKPSDGYASESLHYVTDSESVEPLIEKLFGDDQGLDYGLGVSSNRIYSVEPYMRGQLIGVDVFSDGSSRLMLGINEKKMFSPPSFAIAGSCFPSNNFDQDRIRQYAFQVLDAVDFNFGAAHIEMIVNEDQLYTVEINARLVSAQIPYQMAYAFERSIYADLIDLHLGIPVQNIFPFERFGFSVIRWLTAEQAGQLEDLVLPDSEDPRIKRVVMFKAVGDQVQPPRSNSDRIGYVIATAPTEAEATLAAEAYVTASTMRISA